MKTLTYFLCLFFTFAWVNFADASLDDYEIINALYQNYPDNTLPDLWGGSENGQVKLTKVTFKDLSYLEVLDLRLQKNCQARLNLSPDMSLQLLKGNSDPWGYRGWIIQLIQENTEEFQEGVETPIGFIN